MFRANKRAVAEELKDLVVRKAIMVRGGDGEAERKRRGVNLGTITITKSYDKASPSL